MNEQMNRFLQIIQQMGLTVGETNPPSDLVDGEINLTGEWDGYHLQIGDGYWNAVRLLPSGNLLFGTTHATVFTSALPDLIMTDLRELATDE